MTKYTTYTDGDFARLEDMGWPNDLIDATPAMIYTRHSEWKAARRNRRLSALLMVFTATLVAVWAWGMFA